MRSVMQRDDVIHHILIIAHTYKHLIPWQVSARITLASLFLDGRVLKQHRDLISAAIDSRKILDYDYLIKDQVGVMHWPES